MKWKKFLSSILCAVLSVGMCACSFQADKTDVPGNADDIVSIETEESEETTADFSLWKEDGTITELIAYVEDVTDEDSADFIPVEDRIAVFDLDGTLVGEQAPIYFEWMMFAERVLDDADFEATDEMREVAEKILLAGKNKSIPEDIEEKESQLFGQAFAGMTTEEFREYVADFLSKEADDFDGLTYGEAYYRPMTQVITYLEDNDFKVYVVSGTDREVDRVILSGFTDIPNYQVIGSDYYTEGEDHEGEYYLDYQFASDENIVRDDARIIKDVKSSKVVQMAQEIGQKPVLAFGNSSGDASMMTYTTYGNQYKSAAFCLVPDDDEREYANPDKVESLKATCEENGWNVISMKEDFLTIYGDGVTKNADNHALTDYLLEKIEK